MTDATHDIGQIEKTVRDLVGSRAYDVRSGPLWLMVDPTGFDLPEHGWKLHISCRAADLPELVPVVVPTLLAAGCPFKLARTEVLLHALNDGIRTPATVGKAFTVYPAPEQVRALGLTLVELLRGRRGPRVLSDRRISGDAPVYYRYGPFTGSWNANARGEVMPRMRGPNGEVFDGEATLEYRQPSWATDPFTGEIGTTGQQPGNGGTLLGGHYRIAAGVHESARGNVYRAVDERDGSTVVVKQARALVQEGEDGTDARLRLRNERRILSVLTDVAGVPRFIDHFRHGDDEFLIITDQGRHNLDEDLLEHGRYLPAGDPAATPGRTLDRLARSLARTLLELHERGVVMYDLAPKNVIVDGDRISLIDFGFGAYDGVHIKGGTYGYMPARQRRGEPACDSDDLHALGMTLWYATSLQLPVESDDDHDLPRVRALQQIRRSYGPQPTGVIGAIADLLGAEPGRARAAVRRLAAGDPGGRRTATRLPAVPTVDTDLVAHLTASVRADLVGRTIDVISGVTDSPTEHDASLYSGTAGIALELLRHVDDPAVARLLPGLLAYTRKTADRTELPPGLYGGRTGVDFLLHEAYRRGVLREAPPRPHLPPAAWRSEGDDVIIGAAGVGMGHLALHGAGLGEDHLEVARRCVGMVGPDAPRSPYSSEHYPDSAGVDASLGFAHGLAGVVVFLVELADRTGDAGVWELAAARSRELATRAALLLDRAAGPAAMPLAVSWCQGQSGIGIAVYRAGTLLDDPGLRDLALRSADVCISWVPRLTAVGPCCGAAGVGHLLIDLALATGEEHYWEAAYDVVVQLLLRSGGTPEHPDFVNGMPGEGSTSWAQGLTGLLTFFRRLRDRGGPVFLR